MYINFAVIRTAGVGLIATAWLLAAMKDPLAFKVVAFGLGLLAAGAFWPFVEILYARVNGYIQYFKQISGRKLSRKLAEFKQKQCRSASSTVEVAHGN